MLLGRNPFPNKNNTLKQCQHSKKQYMEMTQFYLIYMNPVQTSIMILRFVSSPILV